MTAWILPSLLGTVISLITAWNASQRMRPPSAHYMVALALMVGWWCLTQAASLLWLDQDYRYFLAQLQYIAISSVPVLWLSTALSFCGWQPFLSRWYPVIWTIPLVTLIMAFTNDLHGLLWQRFEAAPGDIHLYIEYGPWFQVSSVYAYTSVLLATALLTTRLAQSRLYRMQLLAVVAGPLLVLGVNLPFIMGLRWLPIDPTPSGFAVAALLILMALRQNLFSVLPIARRSTVDNISDGVIVLDALGLIADINPAARKMMGNRSTQVGSLLQASLPAGISLDHSKAQDLQLPDGRCADLRVTPVKALDGQLIGRIILLRDVTAERELHAQLLQAQQSLQDLNQRLDAMAHTDELTGLANRRRLYERLREEWSRSARHQHPLSIILLDFDNFKQINDSYGHQTGDDVLAQGAAVLRNMTRPEDLVVRHGGEELAILLPQTGLEAAAEAAERIRRALESLPHQSKKGEKFNMTVSLGVAARIPGDDSPDALIARADKALYHSKKTGRNGVSIYVDGESRRL